MVATLPGKAADTNRDRVPPFWLKKLPIRYEMEWWNANNVLLISYILKCLKAKAAKEAQSGAAAAAAQQASAKLAEQVRKINAFF